MFVVSYLMCVFVCVRLLLAIVTVSLCFLLFYVYVVQRVYLCCVCVSPLSGRAPSCLCCFVVFVCLGRPV